MAVGQASTISIVVFCGSTERHKCYAALIVKIDRPRFDSFFLLGCDYSIM